MRSVGKHKARLGIGGAVGRQPVEMADELAVRRGGGERAVDGELGNQGLAVEPVAQPPGQKLAQRVELVRRDGEPGRHRMAAAVDQQPGLARGDHRRAERQPGDRAPRPAADAVGERDDQAGRS